MVAIRREETKLSFARSLRIPWYLAMKGRKMVAIPVAVLGGAAPGSGGLSQGRVGRALGSETISFILRFPAYKVGDIMVAGLLSFLLLQAGSGQLFPDFEQPWILIVLFAVMGALVAYAIISRER